MSVSAFFNKLMGHQQQKAHVTTANYRDLVTKIATGHEPSHTEVELLLTSADKSVDDLRRDVERYQHRLALKAMVNSLPKLEEEFAEVQQQIAAVDHDLEEAERKHDRVTAPLYGRLEEIKRARNDASDAKRKLFDTCDNPGLERQLAQAATELSQLTDANKDMAAHATWLENKADSERDQAGREFSEADRNHHREQSVLHIQQAESLRRQIKANEKGRADVVKQREQIEELMRQA
jgi:hypothetical protein